MKYALITVIENSDNLYSDEVDFRPPSMEKEAITCFTSWRQNGGTFKDIPIYAMCPTKRFPEPETIKKLKDLNVTYIQEHLPETDNYTCGWWNVPIGCSWMEENLTEDFFIHTDLDMYLMREPVEDLFYCEKNVLAKIGSVSGRRFHREIVPEYKLNFETCFINSWRENRFYKTWYDMLTKTESEMVDRGERVSPEIEEHIVDVMYHGGEYVIEDAGYEFQFGSWYPVKHIEDISKTYFRHEHLDCHVNSDSKGRELAEYIRRVYR